MVTHATGAPVVYEPARGWSSVMVQRCTFPAGADAPGVGRWSSVTTADEPSLLRNCEVVLPVWSLQIQRPQGLVIGLNDQRLQHRFLAGKGGRIHDAGIERAYEFTSIDGLIEDFWREVSRWTNEP